MFKNYQAHHKNGFTLVEVLVSLVLLSIIVLSFLSIFSYTNQVAVQSNHKLVAINLAKLTLERIKTDPYSYIDRPTSTPTPSYVLGTKSYNLSWCSNPTCELLYKPIVNDREYEVSIEASQTSSDIDNQIIDVLVHVTLPDTSISSKVEGYVIYD